MPHLRVKNIRTPEPSTVVVTTQKCVYCDEVGEVKVPSKDYSNYRESMFIKDAFPTLNAEEREQLISGTHPKCWDKMFPEEE